MALRYISKRLRSATRESIDLNSRVLSAMQETVQGITIVKAFTMEAQISERTADLIKSAEERSNRIARLTERTSPLTETVAGLAISGVIAYAAFRSIYGDVLPGAFFSFITALLLAYDPARRLARLQINLERAVVNARMIYEILDEEPTQGDRQDAVDIDIAQGGIEFRDVGFGYGNGEPVLDDVSFTAEAGKTTAIVGPSGAGKSTLISLVPRFYDPSSGQVLIDGVDIATSPRDRCATRSPMSRSSPGCSRDRFATICATPVRMPPMPRSRRPRGWPMPMTSSSPSPGDTTRRWAKTAPTCPVASASASRSPGRWSATRRSCCSTKPPRRSTMNPKPRCRRRSKAPCAPHRSGHRPPAFDNRQGRQDRRDAGGPGGRERQPCRSERHHRRSLRAAAGLQRN
jgi:energy-coupling factor transporter ATP-binding protein EcfA2